MSRPTRFPAQASTTQLVPFENRVVPFDQLPAWADKRWTSVFLFSQFISGSSPHLVGESLVLLLRVPLGAKSGAPSSARLGSLGPRQAARMGCSEPRWMDGCRMYLSVLMVGWSSYMVVFFFLFFFACHASQVLEAHVWKAAETRSPFCFPKEAMASRSFVGGHRS